MLDALPALCLQLVLDHLMPQARADGRAADSRSEVEAAQAAACLALVGSKTCSRMADALFDCLDPGCVAAHASARELDERMRERIAQELESCPDRPTGRLPCSLCRIESSLAELKAACKARGLSAAGTKDALWLRLRQHAGEELRAWEEKREVQLEILHMRPPVSERACPVRPKVRRYLTALRKSDTNITHQGAKAKFGLTDKELASLPNEVRWDPRSRTSMRVYDFADVLRLVIGIFGVRTRPPRSEHDIMARRAEKRKAQEKEARRVKAQNDRLSELLHAAGLDMEEACQISVRAAGAISGYLAGRAVPNLEADIQHAADSMARRKELLHALSVAGHMNPARSCSRSNACAAFVRGDASAPSLAEVVLRLASL